jgi:hypothetical protein
MARRLRRRLTFANVCSSIALFVALGTGGAYAANTIGSDDIIDESIQSVDIKNGEVKGPDLLANAVVSSKIANGTVVNADLAAGAVNSASVLDESLTSSDLATDSVGASEVAANAVGTSEVANKSLTTADIAGAAVNGAISLSGIANGRCTQVTFNVSGAQVGDSPIVTTRAAIQNGILLYPNRVAAAGQVEVNACNFSGTSMTAISNFPVRIVTLR